MQTFLPYADFAATARCLDKKRCFKQAVEAQQILNTLATDNGWRHHPAVKMWRGYELALRAYFNAVLEESIRRGVNTRYRPFEIQQREIALPPWLGHEPFHASHRARLLDKAPEHYSRFGWIEKPNSRGYLWPMVGDDGSITWRDLTG